MSFRSIVKKFIPTDLFRKIEPFGHLIEAIIWNTLNGFPARKFKVIGVTGTNGKTTVLKMIEEKAFYSVYFFKFFYCIMQ